MAGELGREHRLGERPEPKGVASGEQVNGAPHHRDPNEGLINYELTEGLGIESLEPRPESEVGIKRVLSLETDQLFDGRRYWHRRSAQQQLALERRSIQLSISDGFSGRGHRDRR
jgi:hypothetical protein